MSNRKVNSHYCTQSEVIKRMSLILVGNGSPEDSVVFKLIRSLDDLKGVHSDISEIKSQNSEIIKNYQAVQGDLGSIRTSFSILETKLNTKQEEEEKAEDLKFKKRGDSKSKWGNIIQIIAVLIAALTLIISLSLNIRQEQKIKQQEVLNELKLKQP